MNDIIFFYANLDSNLLAEAVGLEPTHHVLGDLTDFKSVLLTNLSILPMYLNPDLNRNAF